MVYRSFEPPSGHHGAPARPGLPAPHRAQAGQHGQRAPADISTAINPLYRELYFVHRGLQRSTTSRKGRAQDAALADTLKRLEDALRLFMVTVDWNGLRDNPPATERARQMLLAPVDDAQLDRIGAALNVDPATRRLLLRDFHEAAAGLGTTLTTGTDAPPQPFDLLHDHLRELSAEVTRARRASQRAMAGHGTATPEQRGAWRRVIIRIGRIVAVLALLLGLASDAYSIDDITRTGIGIWQLFVDNAPLPGRGPG